MAERTGFEPVVRKPTHAFQACAFDRSATSPFVLGKSGSLAHAAQAAGANSFACEHFLHAIKDPFENQVGAKHALGAPHRMRNAIAADGTLAANFTDFCHCVLKNFP